MQLQAFLPLCVVFLLVVDSHIAECRHPPRVPPSFKRQSESPATTDNMPPLPTSDYPENTDVVTEYPEVDDGESSELEDEEDWPYAMMEFTSLVGRCMSATYMNKKMSMKLPKNKFLSRVCPFVLKEAKSYVDSNDLMKETVEEIARENFGFLQCANLLAVKDTVMSIMEKVRPEEPLPTEANPVRSFFRKFELNKENDPESDPEYDLPVKGELLGMAKVLFMEAKWLFQRCEESFPDIFGSLETFDKEFEEELKPAERYFRQLRRNKA